MIVLLLLFCLFQMVIGDDIITTIAGGGSLVLNGGSATSSAVYRPYSVALDSSGNVYIAGSYQAHRVFKVTVSTGIITTIAGSDSSSYSGDGGAATSATLSNPYGVALDSADNVYIADSYNNRIRKVTVSTGIISTFAGTGSKSYSGDNGPATSAALNYPEGVALDSSGNVYISDLINQVIRKVTASTGIITTIVGTGATSYSGDNGPATSAALNYPVGMVLDSSGNLYFADSSNNRVRKVTASTGFITTIAGTGSCCYFSGDNVPATSASLSMPQGVAVDSIGNVYIADFANQRIRKVDISTDIISTVVGNGGGSYSGDGGQATSATLYNPSGLALDASGNIYIADYLNSRIRKVTVGVTYSPSVLPTTALPSLVPSKNPTVVPTVVPSTASPSTYPSLSPSSVFIISTIAGTGASSYSGDNGAATSAALSLPQDIKIDSSGNVYIADQDNHRIRKITVSTGIITTIAGTGTNSYFGDNGQATAASINAPRGLDLDSAGNVYIADRDNHRIRKVTASTGIITTIAGTGSGGYGGDNGAATSATLDRPGGVVVDTTGNVYIGVTYNHRVRKVTASTGIITTIAGTGASSYSGDNGQATSATLNCPEIVKVDSAGNVYIVDRFNNRIRKVTVSTGIITTIAGTGTTSYSGDNGPATSANLNIPVGIALDSTGNVYIADYSNQRIRKVDISTGIIITIAGTGSAGFSGDGGAATLAPIYNPCGVGVDASGNVYIADSYNYRIRKVTVTTNAPSMSPTSASPTASPSNYPSLSPSSVFIMSTIAGTGTASYSGDNGAASSAGLNSPQEVKLDSSGNIYIADANSNRIRKVTVSTGIITTFVGTGSGSYSGDNGPASSASLNAPRGLGLDSAGNLYIADRDNQRIRKVTASTGIITTIAGTGASAYGGDIGAATSAQVYYPGGVAVDTSGNVYIGDTYNHRVRKVTISTGIITTIAGTGTSSFSGDNGQASAAELYHPEIVQVDQAGNVYIADRLNSRIRKVTVSTGIITTIAGTGSASYSGDNGQATSANLKIPVGIALDSTGNVYIADYGNQRVRKVDISTGIITTVAGTGSAGSSGDGGAATSAAINNPYGVGVDASGNVYIADTDNNRIRKVTVTTNVPSMSPTSVPSTATPSYYPSLSPSSVFIVSTIAGTGTASYSGDNGQATSAGLNFPQLLALDSSGNVYIADFSNHRIRKVTVSTGIITTVAGSSTSGSYGGDNGQATSAGLNDPEGVTVDVSGNVYIADQSNHRIRKVTISTGIITTIAGTGTSSFSGDNGPATSATLKYPSCVEVDSTGNIYIADRDNFRIRKVTISTGIITTIAGNGGTGSFSGDGGQATAASLYLAAGICLDASGNMYISDLYNHRIRKVTASTGIITTIAGTGSTTFTGDNGPATSASLYYPYGMSLDSAGNVYIADIDNNRIRKVTVSTGIITTIAGTGSTTYNGENIQATSANMYRPHGVTVDASGNVYYSDYGNQRVRKVTITTNSPSTSPTMAPSTATPTTSTPSNYPSLSPSMVFIITTIAGTGTSSYSGDNGAATSATIYNPTGVAVDSSGNVYVADQNNHRIRKVTVSTGIITTYAGTGTSSYSGDNGQATSAALSYPTGLTVDSTGNVYIADNGNNRIRKVTFSTGIITTIVGTGTASYSGDSGPATDAGLSYPSGVTVDSAGNVYIADTSNHRIRKVTVSTGIIATFAGTGTNSYSGDNGSATSATLNYPRSVSVDSAGNVYIADSGNHRVRKVTISTGIITTIAGTGSVSYSGDNGPATSATLTFPSGVTLDSAGNVYIADRNNNRIRKVTVSTGIITTVVGTGSASYSGDGGAATSAGLSTPYGVTLDSSGNLYIADSSNNRVRKVTVGGTYGPSATPTLAPTTPIPSLTPSTATPSNYPSLSPSTVFIISTFAGTGSTTFSGDNSEATAATLYFVHGLRVDTTGNVYIADTYHHRVRKVTVSTGIITTIAGTGTVTYSGDNGQATSAALNYPSDIDFDSAGNVYISDHSNCRIRKVTVSSGIITTIAGTGAESYSGDNGAATSAALNKPYGVSLDSSGNVYISDTSNYRIRKVTASTGIITTIAGNGGTGSYLGDNGPATSATLSPIGVSVDSTGNIFISDTYNNRVRKVTISTGIITTIAGTGTASYSGDNGPATSAKLSSPWGIAVDSSGNVYIGDWQNHRIRKVTVSTGMITTLAGTGTSSYSGDNGPATSAGLYSPLGVALDSAGNVYIADYGNNRVRKVTVANGSPSTSPTPVPSTAIPSTAAPSSTYPSLNPSTVFIISTVAGTGASSFSGDNGPASSAAVYDPYGVGVDSSGNLYIADSNNHRIRKVTVSTGIITTYAGSGTGSYSGDNGPATSAGLNYPIGVAFDTAGNMYIADFSNSCLRKVTVSTGIITTIAGTGTGSYSGDGGAASSAALRNPTGVALDSSGNVYIADQNNHRVRKVTVSTGIITTFAGTGSGTYSGDNGQASSAALYGPSGVAVDSTGNVYIADTFSNRVRKVTVSTGIITTIAGTGSAGSSGDSGAATSALLNSPYGLTVDSSGNVYIADCYSHRIRKVTISTGYITAIAGTGAASYSGDNVDATSAALNNPHGTAVDSSGNVYIADLGNQRVRKVTVSTGAPSMTPSSVPSTASPSTTTPSSNYPSLSPSTVFIISTIAGTGASSYNGDNGASTSAAIYHPHGLRLDGAGNVYIADTYNNRIRKVTISTGIITTIAGTGTQSYSGDNGFATSAALNGPSDVDIDSAGNIYIVDCINYRIRKVTVSTGIITTIAGTGTGSFSGDNGPATSAALYNPYGIALDLSDNVYIADDFNNRIRKVTVSTGIITTIVGSSTSNGFSGDNGPATSATLYNPHGVAVDSLGNVYFTDTYNHLVRKVTVSTGIITTIAGTGSTTYSGDNGPATSATLYHPWGIALDSSGNIYIGDFSNNRIRKVTLSTGIITTFAGTGTPSYSGDNGQATSAGLYSPAGVALDSAGNVYIADLANNRLRKVTVTTNSPSMSPTLVPSTASPSTATPSNYPSLSPSTVFIISTIAGTGASSYSGDNGAATSAALNVPVGLTFDAAGNLYIADYYNNRIRKVTVSTGIITTFAGSSTSTGYSGDNGQATSAALYYPVGVALDSSGNLYIGDQYNHRVRKVTVSTGVITTIAGTGTATYNGDNIPATSATLFNPSIVTLDSSGNVYIADQWNQRIRKITVSTGIITTIAGSGSTTYNGDNIQATSAALYRTSGVALDSTGNVYIADKDNNRVRKVTVSTGIITTIAGNGGTGSYSGDAGDATAAALYQPYDIVLDAAGNVYIADVFNNRIRKVTISTGIISTIAGKGSSSYSGDNGEATAAELYHPLGVALDSSGNLYIADANNNRVRKVTMTAATSSPSLTPTLSPTSMPTKLPTISPSTASTTFVPSQPPTAAPSILPSIIPTSVPSVIPSTMQPSYTPTLSPSSYPTYLSSVLVYFTVTQGLTGISASTYSSSKASNDALFKQTVVSMLGFDIKKEDVTIQLVTDVVQSRRSLSTVQECVVMYSITTPTFIFNDTNHATAMFIQALNESIVTGVFDLALHANSVSSWQSVSTAYTIFSTASPTSSPTSMPTSAPTKRDNVAVNLLTVSLDATVAKAKVKYYLGTFMGYFLAIYICLYLYSFLRYGKLTATQLYDSSYKSELYVRCTSSNEQSNKEVIMLDLMRDNTVIHNTMKLEEELKVVKKANNRSTTSSVTGKDSLYIVSVSGKLANIVTTEDEDKYSRGYREYVQQQRTLLGCSAFLYPEGYVLNIPCTNRQIVFPPGRMEDILLFLCHDHQLFSCFYFMDGSKLGAHGTRILYIGKDVAVFVLYQFSNMLLQYFMLDGLGLGVIINLFIITPSAVSVGLLLKYLYTCPFTETVEFQRKYAKYQSVVLFLGRLAILPIMVIMFGSLIIACLFSSNRDTIWILVNYFVFVQFYGIILAIAQALLLFIDGYYYKLSMFGIDILCVGQLYKERILAEQLMVDVDYAYRINTYLFGLIKVQKILNRDDAIKAKWITIERGGTNVGEEAYDIEMKGADTNINDETVISVQMNPLTNHTIPRNSVAFSMDGIYSNDSDNVGGYNLHSNPSNNNTIIATENPIHSLASMLNTVSLRPTNTRQDAPRQQPVTLANESVNNAAVAAEDDTALYLEYQALHDNRDEALYDMDGDSQITVTFEEWKSRRKQFKQGTRGSFVKAFQIFEEREQLALEQLEQVASSESVKNTMKLHSNKVKNVLAASRALGPVANKPK